MKKLLFLLVGIACSLLSYAQTNQVVWNNGRIQFAQPIVSIDSLTYLGDVEESDTIHLILPRVIHDTIIQHDTVYIPVADHTPDGVLAVDLGLPSGIKWASCNVGATTPEGYGDYYAWGEITTKDSCTWENYTLANGSDTTLTKYCNDSTYGNKGFKDNKTTLDLEDDAAHVNWGGNWLMPTDAEWTELRTNCTWTWKTQNNVNGYLVKSNTNSNSIFLPAAGFRYGTSLGREGLFGYYWSASLDESNPYSARRIYFYSKDQNMYSSGLRYYGQSVRPVCR